MSQLGEAMLDQSGSSLGRESDPASGSRSVIGLLRRGKEMAQVALGPNHPRRQRHGVDLAGLSPRPHSSLSFSSLRNPPQRPHTSLAAHLSNGQQLHGVDLDEGGGAEIPDIPLKRPSRRVTPDQQPINVTRFDEAWADEINSDFKPQRPINPNSITPQKDTLRLYVG
jgi:hypothetical protein